MAPLVFRYSILKSILFTLLLTIPLIFLLHALAEDVWLKKYYVRIESDDAVMRAKSIALIAKTAAESLLSGADVPHFIRSIRELPEIENAAVVYEAAPPEKNASTSEKDAPTSALPRSLSPEAREAVRGRREWYEWRRIGGKDRVDCVVPFVFAGDTARPAVRGTLMIRYEANTPHPTIRRLKSILAASTVVRGWLIGGTILIVVYFLVLGPIRVMAQIVRARSSGARHLLMPVFRKGEIGELAQSFNRMIVSDEERRAVNDKLTTLIVNHKLSLDKFAIVSEADAQGRITYANDLFCEIAKYSREELIGRDHRIVNSGDHPKSFFKKMWTCIGSGRIWRGEIRNRAKDGTIYWVDGTIIPFMAPNGKPEKYLSIRVPITERKLLEDQIIEQKKMVEVARAKSVFLSVISHELRTPLAVIREGVAILQEDSTGPLNENQKKFGGMVTRNVDRLMNLINDLLDLQKLEAKAMELRPEPTQLAEVIREAVEGIGIKAQTAGVRIINEVLAPLPVIRTDSRRIQQVLYNLIGNAIKFSPKDTEIRVRSVVGDNYVRVEVADQAGGIRPGDLPNCF